MAQNLSAQFVCPSPKVLDFSEKRLHWTSVVCVLHTVGLKTQHLVIGNLAIAQDKCENFITLIRLSIDRIEAILGKSLGRSQPKIDFASDIFPTYIPIGIGKLGPIFLVHTVSPHVSIYRRSDRCQWDPILYPTVYRSGQ